MKQRAVPAKNECCVLRATSSLLRPRAVYSSDCALETWMLPCVTGRLHCNACICRRASVHDNDHRLSLDSQRRIRSSKSPRPSKASRCWLRKALLSTFCLLCPPSRRCLFQGREAASVAAVLSGGRYQFLLLSVDVRTKVIYRPLEQELPPAAAIGGFRASDIEQQPFLQKLLLLRPMQFRSLGRSHPRWSMSALETGPIPSTSAKLC